ncbi:hypothetical protein H9Q13_00670 [Pontibacter sp. JH31]|uniref:PH domain-containing protein n=1 Tax=Pontibacter aquaedesilientis TaxID=2766980 RepID=A0ABR7XBH5_9BACT|nr:hypothetical protein [Pontibacter aquaedesilientis]MBD1395664.1 hypothetical protein [Pontibacter aquaedesilientis]
MKYYNFRSRSLFSGPHLLGVLFIAAGIVAIAGNAIFEGDSSLEKSIYIGVAAILLGITIVSSYNGTKIEFTENRVRDYISILGYQFGEWKDLPNVKRIAVMPVKHRTTHTPNGISPTWSGTVHAYKVFLYSDNPTPVYSFLFSDRENALKTGKILSEKLSAVYELREP